MSAVGGFSRREREILDILYQRGKASATEVRDAMDEAPSNSAVRTLLRVLEEKGHVRRRAEGLKYVYAPAVAKEKAKRTAVRHLVDTYFDGASGQIGAGPPDRSSPRAPRGGLDPLTAIYVKATKQGK